MVRSPTKTTRDEEQAQSASEDEGDEPTLTDAAEEDEEVWTAMKRKQKFGRRGIGEKQGERKREEEGGKAHRKKLRSLPTFASYEDYARTIEDVPEDDL